LLFRCRAHARQMRDAIHKEIEKLKSADVTDEELAMFKTRTRADLLRGLANNQGLANTLAEYQTRYGDWRELFMQLDKVDKVSKADIRRVANQVFVPGNRTEAWIETESNGRPRRRSKMEARNEEDFWKVNCFCGLRSCFCARRAPGATEQASKPWEQIPIPKLHEFKPHQPQRIELKTALSCFCKRITSYLLSMAR